MCYNLPYRMFQVIHSVIFASLLQLMVLLLIVIWSNVDPIVYTMYVYTVDVTFFFVMKIQINKNVKKLDCFN